ncbi:MAG: hypothetical protein ACPGES_01450 [Coraliomargarita sp.]
MKHFPNYTLGCLLGLASFCSAQVVSATPEVEEFMEALTAFPKAHANLQEDARIEASQKAFFQLSVDFPVLTDWVMQDAGAEAWKLVLPEQRTEIIEQLFAAHGVDQSGSLAEYVELCQLRRAERLETAIQEWAPFVFTEGATIRNSFFGYTEGLSDARAERFFEPGGRLSVFAFDEGTVYGSAQALIDDPHGMLRDVDLSFDKEKLAFAWKKSDRLDDYHIYEYDLASGDTKQLTFGLGRADYEPIYLPDGDLVFASTRPEQSVPCWLTEISNLYRMDGEGRYVRRLAVDQVHTIYPQLLNDGRLTYTRWDYSDRAQVYPHPIFSMNPDGQGQSVYYGGNSWFPTSLLHMRPIPGSDKTMAIASGHHTHQNGKLAIIDVNEGRDEGVGLHLIAPKREHGYVPGAGLSSPVVKDRWGQEGDQFRFPYPLSEHEFLISYQPDYGFDPKWHKSKRYRGSNHYGLYWMNADGERELLWRAPDLGVHRMVSMKRKAETKLIPDTVDYTKDTGTYFVQDVYQGYGLAGIERGEAKTLRVVEIDYRAAPMGQKWCGGPGGGAMNSTPVSIGNGTWDVKRILGDAEIYEDGSALFEVPAMASIYHQVLNEKGQVIQSTRTWDTLRPGETKSCIGCHEKPNHAPQPTNSIALDRGAQKLKPFYGETRGFSFIKEIQPILDRNCIDCHDGSKDECMDLRGIATDGKTKNKRKWTRSYLNLTEVELDKSGSYRKRVPEEGLVSWVSQMSRPDELAPYSAGSAKSPLVQMLEAGHHDVTLTEEDYHKLYAWIDLLVPFSGDYREGHAWTETEMAYYDYYEDKRHAQHAEEAQNIVDYLAKSGVHPVENEMTAAFTRAKYGSMLQDLMLSPDSDQQYSLNEQPASLIETLTLRTDATERVHVRLRDLNSDKIYKGVDIEPGKTVNLRFPQAIHTGDSVLECSVPGVTLTVVDALGVRFAELPGNDSNRRHPYAGAQPTPVSFKSKSK